MSFNVKAFESASFDHSTPIMPRLNVLCLVLLCAVNLSVAEFYKFQNTLGHLKAQTSSDVQQIAVENLIKRILPDRGGEFTAVVNSSFNLNGKEAFKISKVEGKIAITGTTGVTVATGFNYYLNYSFVWWTWEQWEKHIDWMALNSFNFVLAFNGQEAIWDRVYRKLNLTNTEIDEQFSGPAFLSWLRMGNLRGWGGPLSESWHNKSLILQHQILDRMRGLGIIPILPAFAGQVPRAFKVLYPETNMTKMSLWNSFPDKYCCPYFIDPNEELFQTIGKLFIEEQIAEYGTDHVYNCDSFNEMDPGNGDLTYLSNVGKSIYQAMTSADSDAIWVLQGWMFYNDQFWADTDRAKSFLTSVPTGKMIVLDLQSEQFPQFTRLEQYFGQPYIWCMLHNFGGTLGMHGSADTINTDVIATRTALNSTMIGTGLTMEGINQNYVIYDLMSEQAWRSEPADLTEWFRNYSRRRGQFAVSKTPSLDISTWVNNAASDEENRTSNTFFQTWYEYSDLFDAWKALLMASDNLKDSPGYLHDVVDVTRQVLQNNGDIYYNKLVEAFTAKNISEFQKFATIFRGILLDLETILATNEAFLLGKWLEAAKGYAGDIKDFLYPRWDEFIYAMNFSLVYDTEFLENTVKVLIFFLYEEPFVYSRKVYTTEPAGDSIQIAKIIEGRSWYSNSTDIPDMKIIPVHNPDRPDIGYPLIYER
ncbi:hypothetical protein HUJ05_002046 [Dendroctonus ponderosae]|nr:hypothetical protein HUJ05_002046 [Dendroctonus ponderosae]